MSGADQVRVLSIASYSQKAQGAGGNFMKSEAKNTVGSALEDTGGEVGSSGGRSSHFWKL